MDEKDARRVEKLRDAGHDEAADMLAQMIEQGDGAGDADAGKGGPESLRELARRDPHTFTRRLEAGELDLTNL